MNWLFILLSLIFSGINPVSSIDSPSSGTAQSIAIENANTQYNQKLIRGINYNPIAIGTNSLDSSAPTYDVPKIAELGVNTIGTYNAGMFEWNELHDVNINTSFYNSLAEMADQNGLNIIVGYFSNNTIDWTNPERRAKTTNQFQQLVLSTKDRPSTIMYLIGNEVFESLSNDEQRIAYAKWIGEMVLWTHQLDATLKVTYADNEINTGLPWIKKYAPELDIYSLNTYSWATYAELEAQINRVVSQLPNKPILLHEWGVDSYDSKKRKVNLEAQSNQIGSLVKIIEDVATRNPQLIGWLLFEYSDQWDKVGRPDVQDSNATWWTCTNCFDKKANEEYWGITTSVLPGKANSRTFKPAYTALQKILFNINSNFSNTYVYLPYKLDLSL